LSVFKDKWIILKIEKIKDKDLLYTIFTNQYWKIRANKRFSKTEKSLDLWYIINFEIITRENISIHKIRNIKISSEFNIKKDKNFSELNQYLSILWKIFRELPDWINHSEIFNIIEKINKLEKIDETKLILAKLKIESIIWHLNITHKNEIISKILKYISNSPIENILKLTWINEELKKELEII